MGNVVIEIVLCMLLPVGALCFFLDRKSRGLIIAFMSGIIVCLCAYQVNTTINHFFTIDSSYFSTTIAPIIEELTKLIPIIVLMLFYRSDIRATASMSFAVGVGFCVVENLYYLITYSSTASIIWIITRCIGTGLMHSISTTIIGLGLYYSYKEKYMRMLFIMSAYFFAAMYHGLYNLLVQSQTFQIVGILIPVLSYVVVLIFLNKDEVSKLLPDGKFQGR